MDKHLKWEVAVSICLNFAFKDRQSRPNPDDVSYILI